MQDRIDAAISPTVRDKILALINQITDLLSFLINLTLEKRCGLSRMSD